MSFTVRHLIASESQVFYKLSFLFSNYFDPFSLSNEAAHSTCESKRIRMIQSNLHSGLDVRSRGFSSEIMHRQTDVCFPSELSLFLVLCRSYHVVSYLAASSLFSFLLLSLPHLHHHFLSSLVSLWLSFQLGTAVSLQQQLKEVCLGPRNPPTFSFWYFFSSPILSKAAT